MKYDIYISEKSGSRSIRIPWLPEKIEINGNETLFASYDVLDKGEVVIPNGKNLMTYAWESTFPGVNRNKNDPMMRGSWQNPKNYQNILENWKVNGTKLRLLITGTPINRDVYLEDISIAYGGGFGDVSYNVSFIDAETIEISEAKKVSSTSKKKRSETQSSTTSYTIKKGDTLWDIAYRFLGKATRWPEIYSLNKTIIESTAKKRGVKSSSNGHWIFPGCKIRIKK